MNETLKLPKTLKLDYNTWRCGLPERIPFNPREIKETYLGDTECLTRLACADSRMCCLGQFANQAGIPKEELRVHTYPRTLKTLIKGLNYHSNGLVGTSDRTFSDRCASINDDTKTTIKEKCRLLKQVCQEFGYTLVFENFPAEVVFDDS